MAAADQLNGAWSQLRLTCGIAKPQTVSPCWQHFYLKAAPDPTASAQTTAITPGS